MEAMVYIAHGSRSEAGNEEFIKFITKMMEEPGHEIHAYGFLESAEPSIHGAIKKCIDLGARKITVIPVLLFSGVHANIDIPREVTKSMWLYPDVKFHYGKALGPDRILEGIAADRLKEEGFSKSGGETVLIVGHGSREPEAKSELEYIASSLGAKLDIQIKTAFLTNTPHYEMAAAEILRQSSSRLYVIPFLLFAGGFTVKIQKTMSKLALSGGKEIVVCRPTGFDEKLMPLIAKRADEASALEG